MRWWNKKPKSTTKVVGWSPIPLPGEQARMEEAEKEAREQLAVALGLCKCSADPFIVHKTCPKHGREARIIAALEQALEMDDEIRRHHKDFGRITGLTQAWREGLITSDEAVRAIQNIVG